MADREAILGGHPVAGFDVEINFEGLGLAEGVIRRIRERALDLSVPLRAGGVHMMGSIRRNFKVGGRPKKWTPLKPATLKAKAPKTKILIDSARLMGSITFKVGRDRLDVGTNLIYARIHQRGGQAGRGLATTIPARPYSIFQESDVRVIGRFIGEHLAGVS
ncbi:phage virion morphogenesis protein [Nitrospinae bacterium AH_259_B05_G02_I21]|nr:phage virion morphogenesis protein [Nitrospinae bacterium AH_259_B05_G02_I21]